LLALTVPGRNQIRAITADIAAHISALIVSANVSWADGAPIPLGQALELVEDRVPVIPGEEYPQIGIRGFGGGLFPKPPVRAEDTTYRHFNRLHEGQFIMSQVKGWEGAVAVCSAEYVSFFASPEYRTFNCRSDRLRPAYFSYLCQTPWFHERLSSLTRGAGARRERLRPEMLMDLEIPLPSATAQAQLEDIFRLAENAQRCAKLSELEHLLPALLDRAFSRDSAQRAA
jgi:type I restriction enzyme, S subunit